MSPFSHASRRQGVTMHSVYDHTYHPRHSGDPVAEYGHLLNGVTLWDVGVDARSRSPGRTPNKEIPKRQRATAGPTRRRRRPWDGVRPSTSRRGSHGPPRTLAGAQRPGDRGPTVDVRGLEAAALARQPRATVRWLLVGGRSRPGHGTR
jgi:hypothetical protein